jgi:two-component system cell cycle response regulator DivK
VLRAAEARSAQAEPGFGRFGRLRSFRLKAGPAREIRTGFPARQGWGIEPQGLEPEVPGMAKTVLIVEDNELNMKLFHDLLEAHGYDTVGTRNGIEALDLARKHRPDLIVMDIQLPEVSGLEVTKWLKDDPELKSIPVVAVTAFAMKGDEERIREGGCEAYLSKPISVGKFLETVRHFLGNA